MKSVGNRGFRSGSDGIAGSVGRAAIGGSAAGALGCPGGCPEAFREVVREVVRVAIWVAVGGEIGFGCVGVLTIS